MTWTTVDSDLVGRICYVANYQGKGSGHARIVAVLENENGERMFDVYRARPHCGRYFFPQKAAVWVTREDDQDGIDREITTALKPDDGQGRRRVKTIVRVLRNQALAERKVVFLNRDGMCHGRDRRLIRKDQEKQDE